MASLTWLFTTVAFLLASAKAEPAVIAASSCGAACREDEMSLLQRMQVVKDGTERFSPNRFTKEPMSLAGVENEPAKLNENVEAETVEALMLRSSSNTTASSTSKHQALDHALESTIKAIKATCNNKKSEGVYACYVYRGEDHVDMSYTVADSSLKIDMVVAEDGGCSKLVLEAVETVEKEISLVLKQSRKVNKLSLVFAAKPANRGCTCYTHVACDVGFTTMHFEVSHNCWGPTGLRSDCNGDYDRMFGPGAPWLTYGFPIDCYGLPSSSASLNNILFGTWTFDDRKANNGVCEKKKDQRTIGQRWFERISGTNGPKW